jgi:hypothetical protein
VSRESDAAKARRAEHEARERGELPNSGVPGAAPLTPRAAKPDSVTRRAGKGFLGWLKSAVITLGALYVVIYVVAVLTISMRFHWTLGNPTRISPQYLRTAALNAPVMQYRLQADPAITPEAAGVALARLTPSNANAAPMFPLRDNGSPPGVPWRLIPLPRELFPLRPNSTPGGIVRDVEILALARGPLTPAQKQGLRLVGRAEAWREYDLVARAATMDGLGGRYKFPLDPRARLWLLPGSSFAGTRELAYAGVMRAAWHLSEGRRDSAEFALRAIISVGQTMSRNTILSFDANLGEIITQTGSAALLRYFEVIGDPRAPTLKAALAAASNAPQTRTIESGLSDDPAEARRKLLAAAADPSLPIPLRFETLRIANLFSCGIGKEIAFGRSPEMDAAIEAFKRDVARYPSDRAVVDLIRLEIGEAMIRRSPRNRGMVLLARGLGSLYRSERLSACAILAATR